MDSIVPQLHKLIDHVQACKSTTILAVALALVGLLVVGKCVLGSLACLLSALTTGSKLKKYQKSGSWAGTLATAWFKPPRVAFFKTVSAIRFSAYSDSRLALQLVSAPY